DIAGKPYLAGSTESANFPVTAGAFQTVYGENTGQGHHVNGFVAKFDPPPPPLIFVPGIAGTVLCDVDSFGPCLWPGTTPFITDHTNLSLDPKEKDEVPKHIEPTKAYTFLRGYSPLLNALKQGGYRAYDDKQKPFLRTFNGCDLTQSSNHPNLFIFP